MDVNWANSGRWWRRRPGVLQSIGVTKELDMTGRLNNNNSNHLQFSSVAQSYPTLCDPIDSSPPGSPIPRILQARTLEWVAISFSNAWKWKVKVKSLSRVRLFAIPWTAAYQAPPSIEFSRKEYWSGVPLPSPTGVGSLSLFQGIFPTQGIKRRSPTLQVDSLPAEPQGKTKI